MGAMALFGEKYGEQVRVIRFGPSLELCGGTHVQATGEIGSFHLVSESSIAAGVRRIEAVTGTMADEHYFRLQDELKAIKDLLHQPPHLIQAVEKLLADYQANQKKLEQLLASQTNALKKTLINQASLVEGIRFISFTGEASADMIKDIAFQLRSEFPRQLVFLAGSIDNGKPLLTLTFSDDLTARGLHAGQLIREAASLIKGGGGGQPHFATAGGKESTGLTQAMDHLRNKITCWLQTNKPTTDH
jgi:alanyl-tRNA synthetase